MTACDSPMFAGGTSDRLSKRDANEGIEGNIGVTGVDLLAMVVSDSGLASAEPQWWNASPLGCLLIGTQPRGGWQVLRNILPSVFSLFLTSHGFHFDIIVNYFSFAYSNRT